jgi:hypothetical protein
MAVVTQSVAVLILAASRLVVKRSMPPRNTLEYDFHPVASKNAKREVINEDFSIEFRYTSSVTLSQSFSTEKPFSTISESPRSSLVFEIRYSNSKQLLEQYMLSASCLSLLSTCEQSYSYEFLG